MILSYVHDVYPLITPVYRVPIVHPGRLACNLVSHQFHCIVEPWIYRDITLRSPFDEEIGSADDTYDTYLRLRLLTRTLAARPDLASLVSHLYMSYLGETHGDCETPTDISEAAPVQDVDDSLNGVNDPTIREDYRSTLFHSSNFPIPTRLLISGDVAGLFLTLLHHLPNLKHLTIKATVRSEVSLVPP